MILADEVEEVQENMFEWVAKQAKSLEWLTQ